MPLAGLFGLVGTLLAEERAIAEVDRENGRPVWVKIAIIIASLNTILFVAEPKISDTISLNGMLSMLFFRQSLPAPMRGNSMRAIRTLTAVACVIAIAAWAEHRNSGIEAQASPRFSYRWPDYSVLPILFVPLDWSISSTEVNTEAALLRASLPEIQQFYGNTLGGKTFRLNDLQVVQAFQKKEDYHIIWNGRNIYTDGVEFNGDMEAAVVDELHRRGYPTPPAQNESGYSALVFVKGAGGYAGGREFPSADGGWAILGDWAIDSIQGQVPDGAYWWSGRRKQLGSAAHELGHSFGLPHPDAYGYPNNSSIMGNWWDYPTLGFNDWECSRIASTKAAFFPSVPEKPAIIRADRFREGVMVLLRVFFSDPNNDATGFGFRGSVWAQEEHTFSNPSYGRVFIGRVEYPFNHQCGTASQFESDVDTWIYDKSNMRSQSVSVHLACGSGAMAR